MARIAGYFCSDSSRFTSDFLDSLLRRMGEGFGLPNAAAHREQVSGPAGSRFGIVLVEPGTTSARLSERIASRSGKTYAFDGSPDASATLAERWDREPGRFVETQDGTHVGFCFDPRSGTLTLYGDRFGLRKTYYCFEDGLFLFGSEIKALLAHPGKRFELNAGLLSRYLSFNYRMWLGRGETFFRDVREFRAAEVATVREDDVRVVRYWTPPRETFPIDAPDQEFVAGFGSRLQDAVRRALDKTRNRLFLVSGGLDSPSVAVVASELLGDRVDCCSAVFPDDPEHNESAYIDVLTKKIARRTFLHEVGASDFLSKYTSALSRFDQPLFAPNYILNLQMFELAEKNGYDGVYGGGGGDRVTGGCLEYQLYLLADYRAYGDARFRRELESWCERGSRFLRYWPSKPDLALDWMDRLVDAGRPGVIRHNPDWIRPDRSIHGPQLSSSTPDAPPILCRYDQYRQSRVAEDLFQQVDPAQNSFEDIASGSFPGRVLDPFWDRALFEYGFRLPVHLQLRDGWTKYVLRRTMDGRLPPELCWRSEKTGLGLPLNQWFRSGPLAEAFRTLLTGDSWMTSGLFNVEALRTRFQDHVSGQGTHGELLWKVFAYCHWAKQWVSS